MKTCSKCTLWKPDVQFYVDRRPGRSRDGRHHACIDCERTAARERARRAYVPHPDGRLRAAGGRFARAA